MATPFQIRSLQRSINSFNDRYKLGQGHVPVDSKYGARTAEESRWMQYLLGIPPSKVGSYPIDRVIRWLAYPSAYWAKDPKRLKRHRDRLAQIRQPSSTHNLTHYEGLVLVSWIAPRFDNAKRRGAWRGYGIPGDQACAWRGPVGKGLQAWLYKRYLAGVEPGPVAEPGKGMHEFCDCPSCRKQIAKVFGISERSAKGGASDVANAREVANGDLAWAGDSDPPHCSSHTFQTATGRY